jgi:hypothetical protein
VAQVVEQLPSKHEALSPIPETAKKKKNNQKQNEVKAGRGDKGK